MRSFRVRHTFVDCNYDVTVPCLYCSTHALSLNLRSRNHYKCGEGIGDLPIDLSTNQPPKYASNARSLICYLTSTICGGVCFNKYVTPSQRSHKPSASAPVSSFDETSMGSTSASPSAITASAFSATAPSFALSAIALSSPLVVSEGPVSSSPFLKIYSSNFSYVLARSSLTMIMSWNPSSSACLISSLAISRREAILSSFSPPRSRIRRSSSSKLGAARKMKRPE